MKEDQLWVGMKRQLGTTQPSAKEKKNQEISRCKQLLFGTQPRVRAVKLDHRLMQCQNWATVSADGSSWVACPLESRSTFPFPFSGPIGWDRYKTSRARSRPKRGSSVCPWPNHGEWVHHEESDTKAADNETAAAAAVTGWSLIVYEEQILTAYSAIIQWWGKMSEYSCSLMDRQ